MHVLLFDLDGTISDPGVGIRNGYRAAFRSVGMEPPADHVIDAWIGPPLRQSFPRLGIPTAQVEAAIQGYRAVYQTTGWKENVLYDGMPELLAELVRRGFRLAVATAKPQDMARQIVAHFELSSVFEFVGGASLDASRDTKDAVIGHVLSSIEADSDSIMIGDRKTDIEGAHHHGLSSIGVTWGYGSKEELHDAGANSIAGSPTQLLDQLTKACGFNAT